MLKVEKNRLSCPLKRLKKSNLRKKRNKNDNFSSNGIHATHANHGNLRYLPLEPSADDCNSFFLLFAEDIFSLHI